MTTATKTSNPLVEADRHFKQKQMTAMRMLMGVALLASVIVFGGSWPTLIVFEIVLIFVFSEILIGFLPASIITAMKFNCIRQNGTWSQKRETIESQSINKLRWNIRVIFLLVLTPSILLVWIVDREVFPLKVGASALSSFRLSDQEWKNNLHDEERALNRWAQDKSVRVNLEQHKRLFWYVWPVIAVVAVVWALGSWLIIQKMFMREIRELSKEIKQRHQEYTYFDQNI